MRKLLKIYTEIRAGEKHCEECNKQNNNTQTMLMRCKLFDGELLEYDKEKNSYLRCRFCIAAEVEDFESST